MCCYFVPFSSLCFEAPPDFSEVQFARAGRPDKAPRQCTIDHIRRGGGNVLRLLFGGSRRAQ